MTRRELVASLAAMPALAAALDAGTAPPPSGGRTPRPLPFNPSKLKGLSEKLLTSHHANNYGGAVKNLSKVEEELAGIKADAPAFLWHGLRERELTFRNSMVLHEAYFGNLGGDGKRAGALAQKLEPGWEEKFRATAMSLAGGSGWVSLGLQLSNGELVSAWSGHHTQFPAGALPLLVLDMYEHAYAIDYGAAAAKYLDAFFANLKWDEVEKRYERALAAQKAMQG
jgi:superoxide dismutase, Fe-Mn family